jgi:hypothetical protein
MTKLTEEELKEVIGAAQATIHNMQLIGDMDIQLRAARANIMALENRKEEMLSRHDSLNGEALALDKSIREKYGDYKSINFETGEIAQ